MHVEHGTLLFTFITVPLPCCKYSIARRRVFEATHTGDEQVCTTELHRRDDSHIHFNVGSGFLSINVLVSFDLAVVKILSTHFPHILHGNNRFPNLVVVKKLLLYGLPRFKRLGLAVCTYLEVSELPDTAISELPDGKSLTSVSVN